MKLNSTSPVFGENTVHVEVIQINSNFYSKELLLHRYDNDQFLSQLGLANVA